MPRSPSGPVGLETRFVVVDKQITSQLGDESVILDLEGGIYYGLDPIGTRIWILLECPRSAQEICDRIQQDYEVEPAACQDAVLALIQDLEARELVKRADEAPATPA
jgi:hypothetical protein